jgi:hypothetical protein
MRGECIFRHRLPRHDPSKVAVETAPHVDSREFVNLQQFSALKALGPLKNRGVPPMPPAQEVSGVDLTPWHANNRAMLSNRRDRRAQRFRNSTRARWRGGTVAV